MSWRVRVAAYILGDLEGYGMGFGPWMAVAWLVFAACAPNEIGDSAEAPLAAEELARRERDRDPVARDRALHALGELGELFFRDEDLVLVQAARAE